MLAAAGLLAALPASAGAAPAPAAPEALPIAVHRGLAEVVVVERSSGPLWLAEASQAWDGEGPASLHARLRDAVALEARRLGLGHARAAVDGVLPKAAPPLPARDRTSSPPSAAWAGGAAAPSAEAPTDEAERPALPPRPPPGVAWLEVSLRRADFARPAGDEGPALLAAWFEAVLTASVKGGPGDGRRSPASARVAFTLYDESPRTAGAWAGSGGAEAHAALERLVDRSAARIAQALLATTGDAAADPIDGQCGLFRATPRWAAPAAGARPGDAGLLVRWPRWTPDLPRGSEVAYDVRAWRLDERGVAHPVLSADGLSQAAARLALPGAAFAVYAWTVRGVATLPDGRRIATPWSQAQPEIGRCAPEPEPSLATWATSGAPSAAPKPAARTGPQVSAAYLPREWTVQRKGLEPGLNAGSGAAMGVGAGLKGGIQLAFACGPFFPVCAIWTVPGGALVGGGIGMLVGGVSSAVEHSSATEQAALAPEPLRTSLQLALGRLVSEPALAARVAEGAAAALAAAADGPEGVVRLDAVSLSLIGDEDVDHPAGLTLAVTASLLRDGAPPVVRTVYASGDRRLPAARWAEGGAALLAVAVRAQAEVAGPRLAAAFAEPEPPPPPPRAPPPQPGDPPPAAVFAQ